MSYYRNLEISGKTWKWHVGKYTVVIKTPRGQRINVNCSKIAGAYSWERAKEDKNAKITPAQVRKYIDDKLSCPMCVEDILKEQNK